MTSINYGVHVVAKVIEENSGITLSEDESDDFIRDTLESTNLPSGKKRNTICASMDFVYVKCKKLTCTPLPRARKGTFAPEQI